MNINVGQSMVNHARPYMCEALRSALEIPEKANWNLIISDDKSGRLPSMIVGSVLKKLGFVEPDIIGVDFGQERDEDYIARVDELVAPYCRALVVTDFISSGRTLSRLDKNISGTKKDFLAVAHSKDSVGLESLRSRLSGNLFTNKLKEGDFFPFFATVREDPARMRRAFLAEYIGLRDPFGSISELIPVTEERISLITGLVDKESDAIASILVDIQ